MKNNLFRLLIAFVFIFVAVACSTSPRGRKVLKLMPDGQMDAMGVQAFDDMKTKVPIDRSPGVNNYIKCISEPLTAQVPQIAPQGGWEIVVFKDDSANAFALPGGKIGVHTGLLKVANTPDQVAAVIGHEIGHVMAEHSNERVSEGLFAQLGLAGISMAMNQKNKNYPYIMGALGIGAQFGALLPHSRDQESEADIIGLDLMSKAGYDPNQAVTLWENMKASGGGGPPEFMSTHPAPSTRIQNIQNHIPEFIGNYRAASHSNCRL
jgi:predicted Zn-dependent protease